MPLNNNWQYKSIRKWDTINLQGSPTIMVSLFILHNMDKYGIICLINNIGNKWKRG